MNKAILLSAVALVLAPGVAVAVDCAALVREIGSAGSATMLTINNRSVASYHHTHVVHRDRLVTREGVVIPAGLVTPKGDGIDNPGIGPQLFSDRYGTGFQPFYINKPDSVTLEITDSAPVVVTVTLNSWGNAKARFTPTCEAGGFLHGVTADVNYLLRLSK